MFLKRTIIYVICIHLFSLNGSAQFGKSQYVIRDPRVDKLVDKQIELNKQALKERSALESGFRILVISTSKRDDATEAKATLMKNYPNQKSYMLYQSPHFKVLFGNFRNYKEADQFKKDLQVLFKDDLNIIPAQIEARGVREETDNL